MKELEKNIGYNFSDNSLLETALTHTSFANEKGLESYERLEYLGDSVLQLIVSEFLYDYYPKLTSGELSKYRSHLVSTKNLASISKNLCFDKYIKKGRALVKVSDGLLADLVESVLAGIYLDGGITQAKNFVMKFIIKDKENIEKTVFNDIDYKTELQEKLQSLGNSTIKYEVVESHMENNVNIFTMVLKINDKVIASSTKPSKRECEKELSHIALQSLK